MYILFYNYFAANLFAEKQSRMSAAMEFRDFLEKNILMLDEVFTVLSRGGDWTEMAKTSDVKRVRDNYVKFNNEYKWWIAANSDLNVFDRATTKLMSATNTTMRKIDIRTHEIRRELTGRDAIIF